MLGLLRWLFIVLLIYYIIKVIGRIFFPILFKKMVSRAEQRMKDQHQKHYQNTSDAKVGETVIDKKPKTSQTDKNVGEYIDYEEVD